MALNALASILETVLAECNTPDIARIMNRFEDALYDCGMRVEDWRDAYYKERLPKRMTSTTMSTQLMNLEIENLHLRNKAWAEGADRKFRLMSSFDLSTKNGHTILVPKTRNAEIILANSSSELKLSDHPSQAVDRLVQKNHELTEKIIQLESVKQDSNSTVILCKAIEDMSEKLKSVEKEASNFEKLLLECDRSNTRLKKQLQICEEETTDRLAAVNAHHKEEIEIMKREIYRLQMLNAQLSDRNLILEEQHGHHLDIIRGLAARAGLVADEVDSGIETEDSDEDSSEEEEDDDFDIEDMMEPGDDEQRPRGGENPRMQARLRQMNNGLEGNGDDFDIEDLMEPGEDEQRPRGGRNQRRQARLRQMQDEMENMIEDLHILDEEFDNALFLL